MLRGLPVGVTLLCLCGLSGCGPGKPTIASVSGTVTIDGKPMENLGVLFQPTSNSELGKNTVFASSGKTDKEGRFTLYFIDDSRAGAVVGEHVVTVSEPPSDDDRDLTWEEEEALRNKKPLIPLKWTNGTQKFAVEEGENDFELELNAE